VTDRIQFLPMLAGRGDEDAPIVELAPLAGSEPRCETSRRREVLSPVVTSRRREVHGLTTARLARRAGCSIDVMERAQAA
jgi:hypothetical protein